MRELCILRSVSYPRYQRFFLACDEALRRPKAEDTNGEGYPGHPGFPTPRVSVSLLLRARKNSNYIVHWVSSSHILFAHGHFLLPLVNDFVRR